MTPEDRLAALSSHGPFEGRPAALESWVESATKKAIEEACVVCLQGSELRVFPDGSLGDVWLDFGNDPIMARPLDARVLVYVRAMTSGGPDSLAAEWAASQVAIKTAQINRESRFQH